MAGESAVSPRIDCTGLTKVELDFQRWLGVDRSDVATIEVSGNGGGTWNQVYRSGATSDRRSTVRRARRRWVGL